MRLDLNRPQFDRRSFLAGLASAAAACPAWVRAANAPALPPETKIESITTQVLWEGRRGGGIPTWFHPRACVIPGTTPPTALMTMQTIGGSDVFGHVHVTASEDLGRTWSKPQPIPGLGRESVEDGLEMGVCDVVPTCHAKTGTVLAMGHNVYYRRGVLARPQGPRWPVYVVRDREGQWSRPQRLRWDDPRGSAIYTSGCSQRVMLGDGRVLLPMSFGPKGRRDRAVAAALCDFDGRTLAIAQVGPELRNGAGRGLLEPSLAAVGRRYYMTIRAEDGRGYVSVSDDGLTWQPPKPWAWDDGQPLTMSTTQQHWLVRPGALLLVYTRKAESNVNVFRWRAPLFMAQVDLSTLRLIRSTERLVLPLAGDGVNDPKHVARMGNFHVTAASPDESWVTVGETLPHGGWRGNLLLARIRWVRAE